MLFHVDNVDNFVYNLIFQHFFIFFLAKYRVYNTLQNTHKSILFSHHSPLYRGMVTVRNLHSNKLRNAQKSCFA